MNMDERNKKYRPDIEKHPVTGNLQKDSAVLFDLFEGCSDLKYNEIHLGTEHNISCIVAFIETTVENMLLDETVLGKMLNMLCTMEKEEVYLSLEQNSFGVSDMAYFENMEDAINGMLSGAALLLIDAGTVSGGDQFPYADLADYVDLILCGGKTGSTVSFRGRSDPDGTVF